ncbi:MAG: RdgB/HAM1 family non-canonical purine NTP pyrophosphatase [Phycisphaerales bacterium]|nr:RdgB/HAM1 family non-canonical purine NTP pyrophosphatase [Phycisphaerales bacterium]
MSQPRHVLLATRSAGKLREIRAWVEGTPLVWHGLEEFPHVAEPEETGRTFAENARLKALYYAEHSGMSTLADDSGLEVDGLGGEPGVHSAYFAGRPRDDAANNHKLVRLIAHVPPADRTARYQCVMAFVHGGSVVLETHGAVEGVIIETPRGREGFGYDPHFWLPDRGRTMAELSPDEKNAISHRGRALRAILPQILHLLGAQP